MEPKISVIVPVYKAEAYLPKCVDSILGQTYENMELILVDDGSPDGCPALCDAYAQRDARVRVIHKKNGGPSSARNAGIEAAEGEYLHFVDSDDSIEPQMLRRLYETMVAYDAQFVLGDFEATGGPNGLNEKMQHVDSLRVLEGPGAMAAYCVEKKMDFLVGGPCWKLFRADIVSRNHIRFPEDLSFCEDNLYNFAYFEAISRAVALPEVLYHYRILPGSLTNRREVTLEVLQKDERVYRYRRAYCGKYGLDSRSAATQYMDALLSCFDFEARRKQNNKSLRRRYAAAIADPAVQEAVREYPIRQGMRVSKLAFLLLPMVRLGWAGGAALLMRAKLWLKRVPRKEG